MFKQSLCKLREEVVKANALVREANFLAEEMGKQTEFHVTLQIPATNLSPNRRVNTSKIWQHLEHLAIRARLLKCNNVYSKQDVKCSNVIYDKMLLFLPKKM